MPNRDVLRLIECIRGQVRSALHDRQTSFAGLHPDTSGGLPVCAALTLAGRISGQGPRCALFVRLHPL